MNDVLLGLSLMYAFIAFCVFVAGTVILLSNVSDYYQYDWHRDHSVKWARLGRLLQKVAVIWPLAGLYFLVRGAAPAARGVMDFFQFLRNKRKKMSSRIRQVLEAEVND